MDFYISDSTQIPSPKFEKIQIDLSGLGWFARVKKIWKTRPTFKLTSDWIITLDNGLQLVFQKGFTTDLASVPRIFWMIPGFSPFGYLMAGSVPHDFGFQHGYFLAVYSPDFDYPISSWALQKRHKVAFGEYVPVFMDRGQSFFDDCLVKVTIAATSAKFIATTAKRVLALFGHHAWDKYREHGPTAYGENSLNLPGITDHGEVY